MELQRSDESWRLGFLLPKICRIFSTFCGYKSSEPLDQPKLYWYVSTVWLPTDHMNWSHDRLTVCIFVSILPIYSFRRPSTVPQYYAVWMEMQLQIWSDSCPLYATVQNRPIVESSRVICRSTIWLFYSAAWPIFYVSYLILKLQTTDHHSWWQPHPPIFVAVWSLTLSGWRTLYLLIVPSVWWSTIMQDVNRTQAGWDGLDDLDAPGFISNTRVSHHTLWDSEVAIARRMEQRNGHGVCDNDDLILSYRCI